MQYKRVGHDFTCDFDEPPSPEFWEPVVEAPARTSAKAAAPVETEESE